MNNNIDNINMDKKQIAVMKRKATILKKREMKETKKVMNQSKKVLKAGEFKKQTSHPIRKSRSKGKTRYTHLASNPRTLIDSLTSTHSTNLSILHNY